MESNELMILSVLSVVLFCVSCWALIHQLRKPIQVLSGAYSRRALQVRKSYGIVSWALMSLTLLGSLVMSFYQVFTQL